MDLGAFSVSLAVKDLEASRRFYEQLGFVQFHGDASQGWLILKNGDTVIGLFQGMFEKNTLTFNPGWDGDANALTVDSLILDLLEWIGPGERPYVETMEAWRTSCPRLPVWEDAADLGFIERHHDRDRGALVSVSAMGAEHLRTHRSV